MNLTLREEDRRAVDLLLDRTSRAAAAAAAGDGDGGSSRVVYAAADPSLGERVARAQKLLAMLDLLPAADPPEDLVGRTMTQVERAQAPVGMGARVPNLVASHRPIV